MALMYIYPGGVGKIGAPQWMSGYRKTGAETCHCRYAPVGVEEPMRKKKGRVKGRCREVRTVPKRCTVYHRGGGGGLRRESEV